jgi:glycosyltransferase involved in cell wall biosynthesis
MTKILFFSQWPIFSENGMACSVGLRIWGLARQLSARGHEVTISEPLGRRTAIPPAPGAPGIRFTGWRDPCDSRAEIERADVVVVQATPFVMPHFEHARPRFLVADLYAPVLLEGASFMYGSHGELSNYAELVRSTLFFLRRGHAFLCAGERQRRYYTGALASTGRINALTAAKDLVRVVPMGIENEPLVEPAERLFRGRWVPEEAEVLLWPGGIYPWFDAATVVRAFARVRRARPKATLLFVGAENPLAGTLAAAGAQEAMREAERLGLPEDAVVFAPWLPYEHRAAMYFEADLAVAAHKPLPEAEFSWRTRTLDCLWGGLPMVATEGDELGEIAAAAGAAMAIPVGDDAAMAEAIGSLLVDPARRDEMRQAARGLATGTLSWEQVSEPLHQLCVDPRAAVDRDHPALAHVLERTFIPCPRVDGPWRLRLQKAGRSLRYHGASGLMHRGIQELRSRLRRVEGEVVAS